MSEQIDKTIGSRIRQLREMSGMSQMELSKLLECQQASLHRYEKGETIVPHKVVLKIAEYFDISIDYIYGRCDKPKGIIYKGERFDKFENEQQMRDFVEMCFEPGSKYNEKLKQTLVELIKENQK